MSKDREKGRGNIRARVTRGSRNPKYDKRTGSVDPKNLKHYTSF
jgi:hypothetical protein